MDGEGIEIFGQAVSKTSRAIANALKDLHLFGFTKTPPIHIGTVGSDVETYAANNNLILGSSDVYMTNKFFTHALRVSKGDKRVTDSDIINFPKTMNAMEKFYDGEAFIYTDRKIKFILRVNEEIRLPNGKKKVVNIITAGKVLDPNEFDLLGKYKKI